MAEIHVYTATGEQTVYPEEQLPELIQAGLISADALYWREGMEKWQSLKTLSPAGRAAWQPDSRAASSPPPPRGTFPSPGPGLPADPSASPSRQRAGARRNTRRFHFRRLPEPLTTILQVLLIACLCASVLELAHALILYFSSPMVPATPAAPDQTGVNPGLAGPNDSASSMAAPDAAALPTEPVDETGRVLFWGLMGLKVILLIPYCMWIHRAVLNCRHFSPIVRIRPAWAVWCHFIPVINFFLPGQVMQEIWKVSHNPRTWHNDRFSMTVGLWWLLALATLALGAAVPVLAHQAQVRDDLVRLALVRLILAVVQVVFFGLFFTVITVVVQRQTRLVNGSQRKPATLPASTTRATG